MFLAAMVSESRRNAIAHVTNLLILGDTNSQQGVFGDMPMTSGGTDDPDAPRDPTLRGVDPTQRLPPASVTDREVELAKGHYTRRHGEPLPDAIDRELRHGEAQAKEWVKLALRELMYQGW